ncbi:MAG: sugar MFS transporter [Mangrovibacterium sp.]
MNNTKLIIFINLMFFQIGLLMSMMSALIPEIIDTFHVSYAMASALPFSFYMALALSCIPAGMAGEYFPPKYILVFTFLWALAGILIFALLLNYSASIVSLFVIGSSVAVIQVTAVPLLRRACGPENLAFHSTLNQLMYGAGAFLSPVTYSFLSVNLSRDKGEQDFPMKILSSLVPQGYEWSSAYWLFVVLLVFLIVAVLPVKFPERAEIRNTNQTRKRVYLELFQNKYVIFFFLSLVAYASCEQGIAAWLSKFFQDYHCLDPQTEGASVLSVYWLLLTAGCFGGMLLLKIFDSRKVLAGLTILAMISLSFALYGETKVSKIAFPLVAACESVMWPVILSLALNSVTKHHQILSGFMFTASVGGALGPVIIGSIGDHFGLGVSLNYLFLPLLIVLSVPFWAKPHVINKIINIKNEKDVSQN